jgi:hypothetical protein
MLSRLFPMEIAKPIVAVYDTKPYDRDYLAVEADELDLHFHERRHASAIPG